MTSETSIAASTSYVEGYLEYTEALPDDMQRSLSQMREIDLHYQDRLKEIERLLNSYNRDKDLSSRRKWLIQIQRRLVKSQEYGDEKLQLVGHMMEMIDNRSRQIEVDMENLDTYRPDDTPIPQLIKHEIQSVASSDDHNPIAKQPEKAKRNRRPRNPDKQDSEAGSTAGGDNQKPIKKKAKTTRKKKTQESPTHNLPIDPNEPTYCLCNQVSFGEMIGCDNEECQIEWFHFQCVGLTNKPKGKWYCPRCSQERKKERNYMR